MSQPTVITQAQEKFDCAAKILGEASRFRVGLAWQAIKSSSGTEGKEADFEPADVWPYLTENWGVPGRLITWVALLFGAQFWFDILRRLVGVRKGAKVSMAPAGGA